MGPVEGEFDPGALPPLRFDWLISACRSRSNIAGLRCIYGQSGDSDTNKSLGLLPAVSL